METEKKKRGRPPKIFTAETTGLTYQGAINYALDKEVRAELDKSLADKDESRLTEGERKPHKRQTYGELHPGIYSGRNYIEDIIEANCGGVAVMDLSARLEYD